MRNFISCRRSSCQKTLEGTVEDDQHTRHSQSLSETGFFFFLLASVFYAWLCVFTCAAFNRRVTLHSCHTTGHSVTAALSCNTELSDQRGTCTIRTSPTEYNVRYIVHPDRIISVPPPHPPLPVSLYQLVPVFLSRVSSLKRCWTGKTSL